MHDIDAIEAINSDQLVTATDWLLLRGVRKSRPRSRGVSFDIQDAPTVYVRRNARPRRNVKLIVATGLVAAYASLAVGVACLLL